MDKDAMIQKLLDRDAIRDVIARYCRAFDRCDERLLRDVYWPDGTHEHGAFSGTGNEFVDFAMPKIRKYFQKSHHAVDNCYFDIRDDTANVETYITAWHLIPGDEDIVREVFGAQYFAAHEATAAAAHDFIFLGRYFDVLERRAGEWRIKRRVISTEWTINQPSTAIWSDALVAMIPFLGKRDQTDPSYFR